MKYIKLFAGLQQNCLPFIILFTLCFFFFLHEAFGLLYETEVQIEKCVIKKILT